MKIKRLLNLFLISALSLSVLPVPTSASEASVTKCITMNVAQHKPVTVLPADNADMVRELAKELTFKEMPKVNNNSAISGKTFCITGDVYTFKNRKELQAKIESLGAKAASSVSAKTDYLINNDVTSGSNKNQKAKQLGVPIISEQDFLNMIGE